MASWAGFSDEDLRRMRDKDTIKEAPAGMPGPRETGPRSQLEETAKTRPQRVVRPMTAPAAPTLTSAAKESAPTPATAPSGSSAGDARGSASPHPLHSLPENRAEGSLRGTQMTEVIWANLPTNGSGTRDGSSVAADVDASQPGSSVLTEAAGLTRELGNLESFRAKQQMMEELNKKKKQMLVSAIAERQKRTSAESKKLQRIQQELAHIDQQLTVDVSILRNRIEESTRDFAEAQRRYDLAEKEFVASKIDMHKKATMKEQLTEHLYTIIHQNELRKAKKLAELMEKLELEDAESAAAEDAIASAAAAMPPILLLDNSTSGVGLLRPVLSLAAPAAQPPAQGTLRCSAPSNEQAKQPGAHSTSVMAQHQAVQQPLSYRNSGMTGESVASAAIPSEGLAPSSVANAV